MRRTLALAVVAVALVAASCSGASDTAAGDGSRTDGWPGIVDVPNPNSVYDPVRSGVPVPAGFRQLLPRDAINPVYVPTFVAASGVGWEDDALVIGVDLEGEARAYPVGFLTRREMVIDNHRGIPTLVTW